jgi:RHS repeat-associated protein
MYDEKGQLVWETHLDIYGKVRTFAGRSLSDCPFRYQGQYEDEETGLYYNRFRYYSPEEGMYLSQDPIGLAGNNPTLYGYVKDVNSWVDLLGLTPLALPAPTNSNPWGSGSIESFPVPKGGMTVEMAMSPGQVKPGGWATTDNITDVAFVREKLAVTSEFKPEISHVQKYHIPEGVQVQVGKVGPQVHNGITYSGGGNQVQILNFEDRAKLQPIGEPRKINCH